MGKSIEKEILKELDSDVATILVTDVHNAVSEAHKEVVESDWYDKYDPQVYRRRTARKGLIDDNNYIFRVSLVIFSNVYVIPFSISPDMPI